MTSVSATAPRSTTPIDRSVPRTDAPQPRRCHDSEDASRSDAPAPRRNPLVAAMMQALGSLMPSSKTTAAQDTSTTAAPASDAPKSGTAASATDTSGTLKDAAMAFAHELFNALRSAGSGRDGGDSASESGRVHGRGHHHHGHGYGDMAQRLERLADQVAAPATPSEPAQPDVSITASLTTASINTTSNGVDGNTTTSVSLTSVNLSLTQQSAAASTAKQESPLLSAFRKLFDALQPASAADAAQPDAASGLAGFLRQLAQSLRNGQDAAAPALPTQGSLISVAA